MFTIILCEGEDDKMEKGRFMILQFIERRIFVFCPVLFLHVPAIGSFSHWVFDAPNEQFGF